MDDKPPKPWDPVVAEIVADFAKKNKKYLVGGKVHEERVNYNTLGDFIGRTRTDRKRMTRKVITMEFLIPDNDDSGTYNLINIR